jgi:MFS family permease
MLIKMILTLPCLFIILVNLVFPIISKKINIKTTALIGLTLYTLGGVFGAFVNDIYVLLFSRALLGMGVGLIMPLSTGLLAYYFGQNEQNKLMGYSFAMNNLGGIIAMSLSGILASIKWNYSFYVYLLGVAVILLVIIYLPKDYISKKEAKIKFKLLKQKAFPIISVFLLMIAFYSYITNFAILVTSRGVIQSSGVGIIMSVQSIGSIFMALIFGYISKQFGDKIKYLGIGLFMMAFVMLYLFDNVMIYVISLLFCGSGMGIIMPHMNSNAVKNLNKETAPSIMAIVSIGIYLGQFISPIISSFVMNTFKIQIVKFPYIIAIISVVFILVLTVFEDLKKKPLSQQ